LINRVFFVCGYDGAPLRYRVHLPAEALSLVGVRSQFCYYTDPKLESMIHDADAVVIHRAPASKRLLKLIKLLQEKQVPVLFDIDDLVFDLDIIAKTHPIQNAPPDHKKFMLELYHAIHTTIGACDAFIGTTEPLCKHAEQLIDIPARRFANGIGLRMAQMADAALQQPRREGPLRIGYLSGSHTHDRDWAFIEPAILETLNRFREVELWFVGDLTPTADLDRFANRIKRLRFQPWYRLPEIIRNLDVNLAPLELGSSFNEAKSAIKWSEAGLVCTPTIASPTQPFREAIEHNVNGLLAETVEDWQQCLARLLNAADERRRVGGHARRDALLQLSPWAQGPRYLEILDWATQLASDGKKKAAHAVTTPFVHEEPERYYLLEPYLTLLAVQDSTDKVTAEIRAESALEFLLPVTSTGSMRIDLRFATYGGIGVPVKVTLYDMDNKRAIGSSTVPASDINEKSWVGFDFQVSEAEGNLWAQVERANDSRGVTAGQKVRSKMALWAQSNGLHRAGGKVQLGAPCVRVWAQEELAEATPPSDFGQAGWPAKLRSKLRSADYLWRTEGFSALVNSVTKGTT